METKILEITGTITKEELLISLDHSIIQNTCVLEDKSPFSGYYGDQPVKCDPCCIFIMLVEEYTYEKILRTIKNIKLYFDKEFNATYAEIQIHNKTCPAIRIRHIENHSVISGLQKAFINEGLKLRSKKMSINSKGIIKVIKPFRINDLGNGTYLDLIDPEFGYIILPKYLSWRLFEKITLTFKNNWKKERFDAALGAFFLSTGITDVIRVYSEKMNKDLLEELQKNYIFHISKISGI